MKIIASTQQVADFFGVSRRSISNWGQSGCPKLARGKWDLKAVFDWWIQNIGARRIEERDEDLKKAKLDYWQAKGELEELKVKEKKKELISREEVARAWAERVAVVVSGLNLLCDRLPPLLEGKDKDETREIIKSEVQGIKEGYTRPGEHTPPPETLEP
ncbi:hypothetical protein DRQ26_06740 [bacterium]|nr:MAG: hypothetical protein DRQ26_06740 [bacterium]